MTVGLTGIAYPQKPLIMAGSGVSRVTRCLKVIQSLLQLSYIVYARSEIASGVVHTYRLIGDFATGGCTQCKRNRIPAILCYTVSVIKI